MTSTRPTNSQSEPDFSDEVDRSASASELQPQQSSSAAMQKSALDSVSTDLMEKIVDDANMERAWKKVKANRGALARTTQDFESRSRQVAPPPSSRLLLEAMAQTNRPRP